jgi:hypothetical protein
MEPQTLKVFAMNFEPAGEFQAVSYTVFADGDMEVTQQYGVRMHFTWEDWIDVQWLTGPALMSTRVPPNREGASSAEANRIAVPSNHASWRWYQDLPRLGLRRTQCSLQSVHRREGCRRAMGEANQVF